MRVFALGWFFDFIFLGVLVARFAHLAGTSKDCSWPALGCVVEWRGGGQVGGFAHGCSYCCLSSEACVAWFACGLCHVVNVVDYVM